MRKAPSEHIAQIQPFSKKVFSRREISSQKKTIRVECNKYLPLCLWFSNFFIYAPLEWSSVRGLVSPVNLDRWSETNKGGNPCTVGHSEMFLTTVLALRSERETSLTRQNSGMLWPSWIRLPYSLWTAESKGINPPTVTRFCYIQLEKFFFEMRFLGEKKLFLKTVEFGQCVRKEPCAHQIWTSNSPGARRTSSWKPELWFVTGSMWILNILRENKNYRNFKK